MWRSYRHFEAERVYSGLSKVHQMGVLLSSDAEVTYFMSRMRASEADREQVKAILDHHVGAMRGLDSAEARGKYAEHVKKRLVAAGGRGTFKELCVLAPEPLSR